MIAFTRCHANSIRASISPAFPKRRSPRTRWPHRRQSSRSCTSILHLRICCVEASSSHTNPVMALLGMCKSLGLFRHSLFIARSASFSLGAYPGYRYQVLNGPLPSAQWKKTTTTLSYWRRGDRCLPGLSLPLSWTIIQNLAKAPRSGH